MRKLLISLFLIPSLAIAAESGDFSRKYEYWENGKVKSCDVFDKAGSFVAKAAYRMDGTIEHIERYDKHGNKIEETLYDEKGNLETGIDGWAAKRWRYEGNTIRAQDGHLLQAGWERRVWNGNSPIENERKEL